MIREDGALIDADIERVDLDVMIASRIWDELRKDLASTKPWSDAKALVMVRYDDVLRAVRKVGRMLDDH